MGRLPTHRGYFRSGNDSLERETNEGLCKTATGSSPVSKNWARSRAGFTTKATIKHSYLESRYVHQKSAARTRSQPVLVRLWNEEETVRDPAAGQGHPFPGQGGSGSCRAAANATKPRGRDGLQAVGPPKGLILLCASAKQAWPNGLRPSK